MTFFVMDLYVNKKILKYQINSNYQENKREKRERVSLFERVTGKKDSRRSDKLNNGASSSPCDLKSPSAFSENRQDYFNYESTNPFTTKFRASNTMPASR